MVGTKVKCILCDWVGLNSEANHDDVVPACPVCGGRASNRYYRDSDEKGEDA